jgi:aminomethyltransferase
VSDQDAPLKTTPLHAAHLALGARMVPFAGYDMPVQYTEGVLKEHLWTREHAGLFDVSHMGQARLRGAAPLAAFEQVVPGDFAGLKPGRQKYSILLNTQGGIVDDLMAGRPVTIDGTGDDGLFVVVNGACKDNDFKVIDDELAGQVVIQRLEDRALLALQGPAAVAVMTRLSPTAAALPFMGFAAVALDGIDCLVSRSGYTGEDGFEISVPSAQAEILAGRLLEQPEVIPIGLGARDSLRLEAGLCLYGNDIDELTSPIEAGLTWVIGKRRKLEWDFPGGMVLRDQLDHGVPRRRVGLRPDGRTPARALTTIMAEDGTAAGTITSGGFGPSIGAPIGMGYVRKDLAADGTRLNLIVRGKVVPATVVPLPFVPHRYIR